MLLLLLLLLAKPKPGKLPDLPDPDDGSNNEPKPPPVPQAVLPKPPLLFCQLASRALDSANWPPLLRRVLLLFGPGVWNADGPDAAVDGAAVEGGARAAAALEDDGVAAAAAAPAAAGVCVMMLRGKNRDGGDGGEDALSLIHI